MTTMRHLTDEELLDAAEVEVQRDPGSAADNPVAVHLAACVDCRERVAGLRRTLGLVQSVAVPEPSPLFWDHLSARIRDAVAVEPVAVPPNRWWLRWGGRPWGIEFGVAAVVALLVAVGVWQRPDVSLGDSPAAIELAQDTGVAVTANPRPEADDPSLALLVDLAGGLEWDAAVEAGMTLNAGAADAVVADLSLDERVELHRLLTEALNAL